MYVHVYFRISYLPHRVISYGIVRDHTMLHDVLYSYAWLIFVLVCRSAREIALVFSRMSLVFTRSLIYQHVYICTFSYVIVPIYTGWYE